MKSELAGLLADTRLSLSDVRDACGVSIGLAHKWVDQKDLSSKSEGRERTVALSDLLVFLAARYVNEAGEHRDRLAAAQADRVEFENEVRRGEFIPAEQHDQVLGAVANVVSQQLSGMPGKLAGELAGIQEPALVRARLVEECNGVRNAVAAHLEGLAVALERLDSEPAEVGSAGAGAGEDDA